MATSITLDKSLRFAMRCVGVHKYLNGEKGEFVLSRQSLLSGRFVAKHAKATVHSQDGNFGSEMYLALQRALEAELWVLLLHEGGYLSEAEYQSINADCVEMIKLTSSISRSAASSNE